MKRLWTLLALVVLLSSLIPAALAQGPAPETERPAQPPQTGVSLADPNPGLESLTGSYVAFDPAVGGDTCFTPGATQTFCFEAYSNSPDWEYAYYLWQRFPTDWTVTAVYVQGTPSCSSGSFGSFVWSFQTSPYEVRIDHPRYHGSGGANCTAHYCFEVTSGTGTPNALESWYWSGDGYGGAPHRPCSNDGYTPPGQTACDEQINPPAAIPPCTLDPIMLTPEEIDAMGCPYEPQEHTFKVWNNTGYDTNVDLTYTIVAGAGVCGGPAQVFVANDTNLDIIVGIEPHGAPGDTVVCEVYAVDATTPANNDTSWIIKNLVSGFFDPAGWQLEPITGATPNQWAGGAVGTNPAAAGPVGYVVGGLAAGSSVPNPDLQMYNPDTATWTQLADMPNWRFSPVVGWIGGLLYAAGGYDTAFAATNDLRVYDPATDTWDNTTYPDMPNARGGGAGGVGTCSSGAGECLFHVGGGPDGIFANTTLETWQYNPGPNAWTQLDNKPAGASPDGHILGAGVGCLGQIYVGGDYRGFHDFFGLDATQPSGSQWTTLANIPLAAGAMTPAMICKEDWGKIVLLGGDPDGGWGTYNTTVFVYDIASDTWEGPLAQTLHVGQLGSVGWHMYDKVWTVGGTVGSGAISPMPFESLLQIICEPPSDFDAWKEAPAQAMSGEVIQYTIVIEADPLVPGSYMVDPLPPGVEFAGNLSANIGDAWYDDVDNTVYWEYVVKGANEVEPAVDATLGLPAPALVPPAPLAAPVEGLGLAGGSTLLILDDFNRADGPIGPNWTAHDGYCNVSNNAAVCGGMARATFNGAPGDGDVAEIDIEAVGTSLQYAGLLLNYGAGSTNLFLKVQQQNSTGQFSHAACYTGNNGAGFGLGFFALSAPFTTAHMRATRVDNDVTIEFTNIDGGGGSQTYVCSGAPAREGTGIGIMGYSAIARTDNFGLPGVGPEPVVITFDVTVTAYCGEIIVNEGWAGDGTGVVYFSAATEVLGEPEIVVDPLALWAELCPDSTTMLELEICNVGTCDLEWEIHEMTRTLTLGGTPFVPVDVVGSGINPGLTAASPPADLVAVPPVEPRAVLWDQPLSGVNQNAYVNQEFPDAPTYSSFLADDFVNAEPWQIESIFVPGNGWNNFTTIMNATALTWQIYADCAGVPCGDPSGGGSPPVWTLTLPPTDSQVVVTNGSGGMPSNVQLNLATPGTLPAGTWWFVFYPTMEFGVGGQYGRQPADTTNGYTGQFINPGGGFGYGTVWQPWSIIGATQQDIAFRIEGQIGSTPPPVDIPWLSEDPISGTVPPGACQIVEVTFDSTAMEPGDYLASLLVLSNDPVNPVVEVEVTMTVRAPVEIVDVTFDVTELTVDFTSEVVGAAPITYLWAFGDGNTSTEPHPVHTYAEDGCYDVTLDVANDCGTDQWTGEVCVEELCEPPFDADFTWTPAEPAAGEEVTFAGTAGGTGPLTYTWALGDGNYGAGPTVAHTYAEAGVYTVVMTVTNDCGEEVVTHAITVSADCVPPYDADFTWLPEAPAEGEEVAFSGSANGTGPLTYEWAFGDGSYGAGQNVVHTYAAAGDYTVVLTVTGQCGDPAVVEKIVTVSEEPCEPPFDADFTWTPEFPTADEEVTFAGTASGTEPLTYAWALGDGSYGAGPTVVHTYAEAGVYTVVMTVTNDCGEEVVTHAITVSAECVPPYNANFTWLPLAPLAGQEVAFAGSANGTGPLTYAWAFGDGSYGAGRNVVHTYAAAGDYTVVMTVTGQCGDPVVVEKTITVHDDTPPPVYKLYLPIVARP